MFIVFFFVLLLSNNLYKINSLSIINLLDNDKEYGDYEKFRKILVKRNKNNFAIEYIEDMYKINDICHHIRSTFISKHLNLKLSVLTTAFTNIQKPEGKEWSKSFNNATRLAEVKILKKYNP